MNNTFIHKRHKQLPTDLAIPGASLPLKIPRKKKELQRVICLLGNRYHGELGTKSREELVELIGTYPSREQAVLWKRNLKTMLKIAC